ncbi:hypothetical protein PsYK624_145220 [Phanerochaete sordida]|uniref:DUF6533 domain-containing protein n=1 Tax=Phanerochaete sordida TaxID=48140 RepID=A0A9P3GP56_9APHY|nr:hypothetical protein PsYK624_145220 [Phanerochaete sordida]
MGALSIYEFLIALDVEVSTAWRRRKTVPSVLLLTIRWCMLANGILTFLPTPGFTVSVPRLSCPSRDLTMSTGVSNLLHVYTGTLVERLQVHGVHGPYRRV